MKHTPSHELLPRRLLSHFVIYYAEYRIDSVALCIDVSPRLNPNPKGKPVYVFALTSGYTNHTYFKESATTGVRHITGCNIHCYNNRYVNTCVEKLRMRPSFLLSKRFVENYLCYCMRH